MKRASWNLQLCVTRSEIEGPKVILFLQICRMQYEHQYVISFFELSYNEQISNWEFRSRTCPKKLWQTHLLVTLFYLAALGSVRHPEKTPCWNFFLSITLYLCPRMTIVSAYVILSRVFDVNWVTCVLCSEWKKLSGHIPLECVPLKLEIKSLNEFKWDHSHRRILI